jgi:hypothetical protein
LGILERGEAPAADDLVGADRRRHFGRHAGLRRPAKAMNDGRLMLPHAPRNIVSAEAIPRLATVRALHDLTMVSPEQIRGRTDPQPSAKLLSEQ